MARRLREDVDRAYDEAIAKIDDASADGTLLRGEVLARWQEFVGTGELLRSLETKVGWLRDRVVGWVRGKPMQAERVTVAVESGLETLILEHAETAAERAEASWRSVTAGQHLAEDSGRDLGRASRDFRVRAERSVRDWQHGVLEMVRSEGADKRSTARFLAFGVNGLSVALMVVVFAHTAGVSGAEVGIAGGSAVVGQKLLEAVFGDQAVRRLADAARAGPQRAGHRADGRPSGPASSTVLDDLGIEEGDVDRLREVSRRVDDLRFADKGRRHDARHGELRVTALVEGAKKLVGRRSDVADRIDGLDEAARCRARAPRRRAGRRGRRRRRAGRCPAPAVRRPHGRRAGRCDRVGQVLDVQRRHRPRARRHRRTPPDHVVDDGLRLGGRRGAASCSTGWASPSATR